MKIENILANKVIKLGIAPLFPVSIKVDSLHFGVFLEAPHVADWSIKPDIKKLARSPRDLKSEIGRIA